MVNKDYITGTHIQKHGRAMRTVFWFLSTILLRHTVLINKVQKHKYRRERREHLIKGGFHKILPTKERIYKDE